jgi:hypothetical protein
VLKALSKSAGRAAFGRALENTDAEYWFRNLQEIMQDAHPFRVIDPICP